MATPFERIKAAWESPDRRAALNHVVETMAAEGVTLDALDRALERLLDEIRAAGADDDTEEIIMGVGDRLHGWCHENWHIKTRPAALPTAEELETLPRLARLAFGARCVFRVLPLFRAGWPQAPAAHQTAVADAVVRGQAVAATAADPSSEGESAARIAARAADANEGTDEAIRSAFAAADVEEASLTGSVGTLARAVQFAYLAAQPRANILPHIRHDFDTIRHFADAQRWSDDTPVQPQIFGPLWPDGPPPRWPETTDSSPLRTVTADFAMPIEIATPEPPGVNPLIDVYFAGGDFSAEEMQTFLDYLAATYREFGGAGLRVVEHRAEVFEGVEVPR